MSGLGAFPLIRRATALILQTLSWVFSLWVPLIALVRVSKAIFAGVLDFDGVFAAVRAVAISLVLAWLLSRAARALLNDSRRVSILFGVFLAVVTLALVLSTRGRTDRVQEAVRFAWATAGIIWSVAVLFAAGRRHDIGERAGR
jgi:hypothetical protein